MEPKVPCAPGAPRLGLYPYPHRHPWPFPEQQKTEVKSQKNYSCSSASFPQFILLNFDSFLISLVFYVFPCLCLFTNLYPLRRAFFNFGASSMSKKRFFGFSSCCFTEVQRIFIGFAFGSSFLLWTVFCLKQVKLDLL